MKTPMPRMTLWGAAVSAATACFIAAFVGARLARADPGGRTRQALTVAGTLTGMTGSAMVTFRFLKGATVQCEPVVMVVPGSGGTFSAEVPLDQAGHVCPDGLFDGSDVTVAVVIGGATVVNGAAVNPVPYARYADQVGTPDCPVGYERAVDAVTAPGQWFCRRGVDEVVRVGDGQSALWVDRHEASVWTTRGGSVTGGTQLFRTDNDFDSATTPRNGLWHPASAVVPPPAVPRPSAYALSVSGVRPASWITWFQAAAACRASGKRLPDGEEWFAAADGTSDPGDVNGDDGRCRTGGGSTNARSTGLGNRCRSGWGAQDMIGNVWEWTSDWYAGIGRGGYDATPGAILGSAMLGATAWTGPAGNAGWPITDDLYHGDKTWNITSAAAAGTNVNAFRFGLPAVLVRGGGWRAGNDGGTFALLLNAGPSSWNDEVGFRCVIPR